MKVLIIWPNTLYEDNELVSIADKVYIVEHPLFFTKYNYHKMKLVLHRSTMKYYHDYLVEKYPHLDVKYINVSKYDKFINISKQHTILFHDPVDHIISNEFRKYNTEIHPTKSFIMSDSDLLNYYNLHKNKNQRHSIFYNYHKDILLVEYLANGEENNKVKTWNKIFNKNHDEENRNKFPEEYESPKLHRVNNTSSYITDAIKYVERIFPNNPGDSELIYEDINFGYVKKLFSNFLKKKLIHFGDYQDAVRSDVIFGNHSVLSPFMNIGMIEPRKVLHKVIKFYNSRSNKITVNNIEGYLRQIIGWREYCRYIYLYFRTKLIKNPRNAVRKLNKRLWYDFDTQSMNDPKYEFAKVDYIPVMLDKVKRYAYLHHIERLMYIGNFMLLYEIHPKEVFNWFQCMFLDSYHVFMYPNVYGMSQHTTDLMMSKMYICSSNYVHNMSDYSRNDYVDNLYKKLISRINKHKNDHKRY